MIDQLKKWIVGECDFPLDDLTEYLRDRFGDRYLGENSGSLQWCARLLVDENNMREQRNAVQSANNVYELKMALLNSRGFINRIIEGDVDESVKDDARCILETMKKYEEQNEEVVT